MSDLKNLSYTLVDVKDNAKKLKKYFDSIGVDIKLGHVREGLVRLHNAPDWNTYLTMQEPKPIEKPAEKDEFASYRDIYKDDYIFGLSAIKDKLKDLHRELLALIFVTFTKSRKEGLMSLEKDIEYPHESNLLNRFPIVMSNFRVLDFFVFYSSMMIMGVLNPDNIEKIMDKELAAREKMRSFEPLDETSAEAIEMLKVAFISSLNGYSPNTCVSFAMRLASFKS